MNASEIIGIPILIGNLQVSQFDFENEFSWAKAKKVCKELGNGWHLPSKDELNVIFLNKDMITGLSNSNYWSSTEHVGFKAAWIQKLSNGSQNWVDNQYPAKVRAVKLVSTSL